MDLQRERERHLISSIPSTVREVRGDLANVVRAHFELALAEIKDVSGLVKQDLLQAAIYGALALLGVLPLMAFFVLGLGALLGGRYWLSALVVSLAFFALGGGMAFRAVRLLKKRDLSLPRTQRALGRDLGGKDKAA